MTSDNLTVEQFVAESGWRLAKTMLDNPHQYTVRDLINADARHTTAMGNSEFEWFCEQILAHGTPGQWWNRTYLYLFVGEWFYWTMGEAPSETTIINRKPNGPNASRQLNQEVEAALFAAR